jgi:hypothetical protein
MLSFSLCVLIILPSTNPSRHIDIIAESHCHSPTIRLLRIPSHSLLPLPLLTLLFLFHHVAFGVQAMSFTYASSVQLGGSVTVTWQRSSSEPTQFTLKLLSTSTGEVDPKGGSHDLLVPDGQFSGTEIFLPSVVG